MTGTRAFEFTTNDAEFAAKMSSTLAAIVVGDVFASTRTTGFFVKRTTYVFTAVTRNRASAIACEAFAIALNAINAA